MSIAGARRRAGGLSHPDGGPTLSTVAFELAQSAVTAAFPGSGFLALGAGGRDFAVDKDAGEFGKSDAGGFGALAVSKGLPTGAEPSRTSRSPADSA
jgi:hypothetical protein